MPKMTRFEMNVRESSANLYHVPQRQWRKWAEIARRVFNEVYSGMSGNQSLFVHPKAACGPRSQWRTTSWNAAWTSADAVMAQLKLMSEA